MAQFNPDAQNTLSEVIANQPKPEQSEAPPIEALIPARPTGARLQDETPAGEVINPTTPQSGRYG